MGLFFVRSVRRVSPWTEDTAKGPVNIREALEAVGVLMCHVVALFTGFRGRTEEYFSRRIRKGFASVDPYAWTPSAEVLLSIETCVRGR